MSLYTKTHNSATKRMTGLMLQNQGRFLYYKLIKVLPGFNMYMLYVHVLSTLL